MIRFNYFLIFNVLVKLRHAEKKAKFMQSTLENSCSGKKLFCHEYAMAPGATGELVCIYRNCIYIQIRFQPAFGGGEGSPFFPQPQTDSALSGLDACIKTSADMHLFHKSKDKERGLLPAVFLPLFSNHANNLSSGTNCCVRGHWDVGGKEMWVGWGCRRGGNVRGMEMQVGWGWGWDGDVGGMEIQTAAAPGPRGTSVPASYVELEWCCANFRCLHSALELATASCYWCQRWAGESTALLIPRLSPVVAFSSGHTGNAQLLEHGAIESQSSLLFAHNVGAALPGPYTDSVSQSTLCSASAPQFSRH